MMPLKNSYAYTSDQINSCENCCKAIPCFPHPCRGEKHWEGQIMDLREMVNYGEQSAQTLTEGANLKSGQTVHGQNVVGKYKRNIDTPYWCWIQSPCPKEYDTIIINGQTIAKVSDISSLCSKAFSSALPACCTGQILVQDGNEKQLGRIITANKKKGCCVPFVSVRNPSGNQLYGFQENKDCCSFLRCCSKKYDILDGENEEMAVGQAIKRNNICITCCHWRFAIDITMPQKATEADKVLLLATVFQKAR